ncbi:MAG: hypothetical protein LC637_05030 [Xanthomonadaceae bacterium]|nr:hypothetical protein [Xanthomonadaceae bacterium]
MEAIGPITAIITGLVAAGGALGPVWFMLKRLGQQIDRQSDVVGKRLDRTDEHINVLYGRCDECKQEIIGRQIDHDKRITILEIKGHDHVKHRQQSEN